MASLTSKCGNDNIPPPASAPQSIEWHPHIDEFDMMLGELFEDTSEIGSSPPPAPFVAMISPATSNCNLWKEATVATTTAGGRNNNNEEPSSSCHQQANETFDSYPNDLAIANKKRRISEAGAAMLIATQSNMDGATTTTPCLARKNAEYVPIAPKPDVLTSSTSPYRTCSSSSKSTCRPELERFLKAVAVATRDAAKNRNCAYTPKQLEEMSAQEQLDYHRTRNRFLAKQTRERKKAQLSVVKKQFEELKRENIRLKQIVHNGPLSPAQSRVILAGCTAVQQIPKAVWDCSGGVPEANEPLESTTHTSIISSSDNNDGSTTSIQKMQESVVEKVQEIVRQTNHKVYKDDTPHEVVTPTGVHFTTGGHCIPNDQGRQGIDTTSNSTLKLTSGLSSATVDQNATRNTQEDDGHSQHEVSVSSFTNVHEAPISHPEENILTSITIMLGDDGNSQHQNDEAVGVSSPAMTTTNVMDENLLFSSEEINEEQTSSNVVSSSPTPPVTVTRMLEEMDNFMFTPNPLSMLTPNPLADTTTMTPSLFGKPLHLVDEYKNQYDTRMNDNAFSIPGKPAHTMKHRTMPTGFRKA